MFLHKAVLLWYICVYLFNSRFYTIIKTLS